MDDASSQSRASISMSGKAVGFGLGALLGPLISYLFTAVPFAIGLVVVPAFYPSISGSGFLVSILLPVALGAVLGVFSGVAVGKLTPFSGTFVIAPLVVVAYNTWRMYAAPEIEGQMLLLTGAYLVAGSAFPVGFLAGIRKRPVHVKPLPEPGDG